MSEHEDTDIRIAAFGDVVGPPGLVVLEKRLRELREAAALDLVLTNAENLHDGSGITPGLLNRLYEAGVDVVTSGDHIVRRRQIFPVLDGDSRVLRPANFPAVFPGRGHTVVETAGGVAVGVVNVLGRQFMNTNSDCPFAAVEAALADLEGKAKVVLVDLHAEATSEKIALGWHFDGRVSAIFGTHTHVPTADERVLPKGTAYITDLGMTGPYEGVIGRSVAPVLQKMVTQMPARFTVATGDVRASGVILRIDPATGKATGITRIQVPLEGDLPEAALAEASAEGKAR